MFHIKRDTSEVSQNFDSFQWRSGLGVFGGPLGSVKHCITCVQNIFFQDLLLQVLVLNHHCCRAIERVIVYLQPFSFDPKMVENTLNFIKWQSSAIIVTNYVILVNFSSFLKD